MTKIAQFTDFVGIDISKSHLDNFILPDGEVFRISNDRLELWELLSLLSRFEEALVLMEATGATSYSVRNVRHHFIRRLAETDPECSISAWNLPPAL